MSIPWKDRFLAIVERTFVNLHQDFISYNIGQTAAGEKKKRYFDSELQGIEFADELTVCSSLVNNMISSPMISGDFDEESKDELKFYKIRREAHYNGTSGPRVDLIIQRVNYERIIKEAGGTLKESQEEKAKEEHKEVFIEAKMAERYSNSDLTKDRVAKYSDTINELKKNIKEKFDDNSSRIYHAFIWGVYDKQNNKNTPKRYLSGLKEDHIYRYDHQVRWVPIGWKPLAFDEEPDEKNQIDKWCWALLVEITKIDQNEK